MHNNRGLFANHAITITRRDLLKAGLASSFLALIPISGFAFSPSEADFEPIGDNADSKSPYQKSRLGFLSTEDVAILAGFSAWCIQAWGFTEVDDYPSRLGFLLELKTKYEPSYLSEYQNAVATIGRAAARSSSDNEAWTYLMFAERNGRATLNTRLGRARHFVFDELVRHLVANGGFKRFGLINYDGFINLPFDVPGAYRRGGA